MQRAPRARPLRPPPPARPVAAPDRRQPRDRLVARPRAAPRDRAPTRCPSRRRPGGRREIGDELVAALADLGPEHRAVVVLRHLLGYTPGEIAAMLDLPRGTVNSRLRRALDALALALEERAMTRDERARARAARGRAARRRRRARARAPDRARRARAGAAARAASGAPRRSCGPRSRPRSRRSSSPSATAGRRRRSSGSCATSSQAPAKPAPTPVADLALPASGRLLVSDADGLYVVARSGKRTRLGALRRRDLVAATGSTSRATLRPHARRARPDDGARPLDACGPAARSSLPRWSPDGLHIAYRAGGALRIVYGNGEHDVLAGRDMAPVAPAWRPGTPRAVAWAATDGTVTVEDADTAKVLWTHRGGPVHHLAWSGDGRRLLIAGRRHGAIHDLATGRATKLDLGPARSCWPRPSAATGSRSPSAAPRATELRARGGVLPAARPPRPARVVARRPLAARRAATSG